MLTYRRFHQLPRVFHRSYFRVCIVGSGPSAFYTAKYLLDKHADMRIDMVEKLPTPYGLVRYGVAPDHPEVKAVEETFAAVARNPSFRFFGNIQVGVDIPLTALQKAYSAVILAYGAQHEAPLRIPGEEHVLSARQLVNWYNGYPLTAAQRSEKQRIQQWLLPDNKQGIRRVVIIGQGNVALDCARILFTPPDHLASTDISREALQVLRDAVAPSLQEVQLVGRRGYMQIACTIKELRELTRIDPKLPVQVLDEEMRKSDTDASRAEVEQMRPRQRLTKLIEGFRRISSSDNIESFDKRILLRFLLQPCRVEINDSVSPHDYKYKVVFGKCRLEGPPHAQKSILVGGSESSGDGVASSYVGVASRRPVLGSDDDALPSASSKPLVPSHKKSLDSASLSSSSADELVLEADLVLSSVGYRGSAIDAMEEGEVSAARLPFDFKKGVIHTQNGRVVRPTGDRDAVVSAAPVVGLYAAGWIKRGATGIIGTNIPDAKETVQSVTQDLEAGILARVESDPQTVFMSSGKTGEKYMSCQYHIHSGIVARIRKNRLL